ncbi:Rad9-domain-containing protein [Endogone sp. FLAS-F59071]|nr:Rad9-domain-containing protein [Endogone sp. FLAS-F59071]|eukprot:RUS16191.1 Rad9-domain-containing protein [Endogone sp. FLAS-F59071]
MRPVLTKDSHIPMNATIPAPSLKHFSRVLACLSKIGDDLIIDATKEKLVLTTINSSRSAYAIYYFAPKFFDEYRIEFPRDGRQDDARQNRGGGSAGSSLVCQVLLKTLTTIFRSKNNLDQNVERCELRLEDAANNDDSMGVVGLGSGECRLMIRMVCKYGILITHKLIYSSFSRRPKPAYSKDRCPHRFVVTPRLVSDWIAHFHPKLAEVTLSCAPDSVCIRSFWDEEAGGQEKGKKEDKRGLQTELTLDPEEFSSYEVQHDVEMTFNLKEFKAIMLYAERMELPVSAFFEGPGSPIIFSVQTDITLVDFVLATFTDPSTPSQPAAIQQATTPARQVPRSERSQQPRSPYPYVGTTSEMGSPSMIRHDVEIPGMECREENDDEEEERLERRRGGKRVGEQAGTETRDEPGRSLRRDNVANTETWMEVDAQALEQSVMDNGRSGVRRGEEGAVANKNGGVRGAEAISFGDEDAEMIRMPEQGFEDDDEEIAPTPPIKKVGDVGF